MGGEGPYYTFYRPHHLTSLEVPLSAARAVLYNEAEMFPLPRPIAEVCARAKRDLQPGELLDAIGETSYRSFAMTAQDARAANGWPVGMLHGGKVTSPIAKGELITRDKVALDADTPLMKMRLEMEAMFWGGAA
jgi:predicted homoserine dehydrogenase-like protein